ncbi:MAG: hypothetical protein PVI30_17710 [Myxococcales bacterium]
MGTSNSYDVWIVRFEGDQRSQVTAITRIFRVPPPTAMQILRNLPRLVAPGVPQDRAKDLARALQAAGGVVHIGASGQAPDFGAGTQVQVSARPVAETAAARRRPRNSMRDRAAAAARQVRDAAEAHWPEPRDPDDPYDWHLDAGPPPPVPVAVRHSPERVAGLLAASLTVIAIGLGAAWSSGAFDPEPVSRAQIRAPAAQPQDDAEQDDAEQPQAGDDSASAPSRDPERLAAAAQRAATEAFDALRAQLAAALDADAEPFSLDGQVVGALYDVPARDTRRLLAALRPQAQAGGAVLVRYRRGHRVGGDLLALLPADRPLDAVRLIGTAGPGLPTADVVAWLSALHAEQAIHLEGVGEHFVEGRFQIPVRDPVALEKPVYACPAGQTAPAAAAGNAPDPTGPDEQGEQATRAGTPDAAAAAERSRRQPDTIATLEGLKKGERFACSF